MKNLKIFAVVLILTAAAVGTFYISQDSTNKKAAMPEEKINVAFSPDELSTVSLLDFAEEKEIFKKNNLSIERKPQTKNIAATLKSGEVDVTLNPVSSSLTAYLNGEDTLWIDTIANYPSQTALISRLPKDQLSSAKKAAVSHLGGVYHIYTEAIAPSFGIGKLDYIVAPAGPSQLATLEQKKSDVILADYTDENIKKYADEKGFTVIKSDTLFKDVKIPIGIFTTDKIFNNKQRSISSFTKSVDEIKSYVKNHQEEYKKFLKEKYALTDEMLPIVFENLIKASTLEKPKTEDIKATADAVKKTSEPSQPDRDLNQFIKSIK